MQTTEIRVQAAIVMTLVIVSLVLSITVPYWARTEATAWLAELDPPATPAIASFEQIQATDVERSRLKDQFSSIKARATHHLTVATFFFSNYYMALIQAFVMGAVAAVALFFITKQGY